jgi:hypothetical protein
MGDVAIVNIHHQAILFPEIKAALSPKYCLLFDVNAQQIQLPFAIPHYQIQPYGGCVFMMAPAFTAFDPAAANAKLDKTKLWVSLKEIFKV